MKAIVCGSCVVDLTCLQVDLQIPLGENQIHAIDPIQPTGGGITCNTGISLQRLGIPTGVLTYVGNDSWGEFLKSLFTKEGLETSLLRIHPTDPSTAVVVLVDARGARSFLVPETKTATKSIDQAFLRDHWDVIAQASHFILGYFGRMPALEPDLPDVLRDIRATGCRTVMDSAGHGGDAALLRKVLPHLDVYIPSEAEAHRQTGYADPERMLASFREVNRHGILGVKLGRRGSVLHHPEEGLIAIDAIDPGEPVLDTTGAGDCFMAGLIAALDRGCSLAEAGRWASAAGACAITRRGGYTGLQSEAQIRALLE